METQAKQRALTGTDRCDHQCGANAFVRVEMLHGTLLFCRAHARMNAAGLQKQEGILVFDFAGIERSPKYLENVKLPEPVKPIVSDE